MILVGMPVFLARLATCCVRWEHDARRAAFSRRCARAGQGGRIAGRRSPRCDRVSISHNSCARRVIARERRGEGLGPDLAAVGKTGPAGADLVEAILEPSKTIRKGYETVTVVTKDGKTLTGRLIEERPEAIVLREAAPEGKPITIARAEIDERRDNGPSLMPAGLVNQLGSRQEFLDLVRYLIEIAERGPAARWNCGPIRR